MVSRFWLSAMGIDLHCDGQVTTKGIARSGLSRAWARPAGHAARCVPSSGASQTGVNRRSAVVGAVVAVVERARDVQHDATALVGDLDAHAVLVVRRVPVYD